ncbi:hypothetical protein AVEN_124202-1 [Araneus ventricosus]|uniref:Tc1-like transposase DDE domain-containing protein n=1 Tax=Araneus ventricosus TaxID=182803 RepID=A0A4Y2HTB9_ARAVE|nr:hypothetical protein AVEN_124202-1 [Araneus ventricosus]
MVDGRKDLHIFDMWSVTSLRYRYEILQPIVRLIRCAVGPGFLFMDNNAPSHRAALVEAYLQSEGMKLMYWPIQFPKLKPMEHE